MDCPAAADRADAPGRKRGSRLRTSPLKTTTKMNIVFYAVPESVAEEVATRYGFELYRSAEAFEASILADRPSHPVVEPEAVSEPEGAEDAASSPMDELVPVAADVADGQLVIPAEPEAGVEGDEAPAGSDVAAEAPQPADVPEPGSQGRILLLSRLDSEERQSEFFGWMERHSDRVDAVISGQSSTISTIYYASQPGKFFSVERRHSDDDCEDLTYELTRILDALLGGGTAHEEI